MKANPNNITTAGGRAFLGAVTAASVTAILPAAAEAAPDAKEAELIRLCNRLVAIRAEQSRLYATMPQATRDQEREVAALLAPGHAEWREIEARIYELDITPKTRVGISAVARAALANAERDLDGEIATQSLDEWLAWSVIEAIEPGAAAAIKADAGGSNAASLRLAGVAS